MAGELEMVLAFLKLSGKLKYVERHNKATAGRRENSAEHSWSIALFVMCLRRSLEQEFGKKLDGEKMLKMALVHDLVEIEAGDASIWDSKGRMEKASKEEAAAEKLFALLPGPEGGEMVDLWHEFEQKTTLEAKVVKAIDALTPVVQRITTGQGWADANASVDDLDEMKLSHVQFSKTLLALYELLRQEAQDGNMFVKKEL